MSLITNNLLQQGLSTNKLNLIVIEPNDEQIKKELLSTKQNILFVSQSQQIHTYIGYNFALCFDVLTNAKQLLDLSNKLHLPICVYINKPLPELTKVDINQIHKTLAPMMIVFENEELEQNWFSITTNGVILTEWNDVFDLMKTRVFKYE